MKALSPILLIATLLLGSLSVPARAEEEVGGETESYDVSLRHGGGSHREWRLQPDEAIRQIARRRSAAPERKPAGAPPVKREARVQRDFIFPQYGNNK